MKKAKDVQEFVERIDATKKVNPKDLSSDQDLTIAIMNLISIEEHLVFSGAKTGKNSFYDLIEEVRELRKTLMQKVIPQYEGEVWCISKHLLASAMRLMEVGTKQQSLGHRDDAYKLFNHAYELYCLFWGLNMNMLDTADVKWIEDKREDAAKISEKLERAENAAADKSELAEKVVESAEKGVAAKPQSALSKMKSFVRKAVDCCIE